MNSSFGTTVARHRRPHFRHCLASGPLADQLCTSRFGEREISTTIYWGLLKQPDNQKPATRWAIARAEFWAGRGARSVADPRLGQDLLRSGGDAFNLLGENCDVPPSEARLADGPRGHAIERAYHYPNWSLRKIYELLSRSLRAGCSNQLAGLCTRSRARKKVKKVMNVVFLLICSLSVVFFGVFLVECSRPVRKSKKAPVVRKSTEAAVGDSTLGRRFFVHLEQQMAEFLSHHGQTSHP